MYFNRDELYDRIYGCWMGKNIGGTLGTPYEGRTELLDVQGFASQPGKPLPNDDLDLQLIWLAALERFGPLGVNERVLGEMWLDYIPPHWNEYGIGKSNMRAGLPPPLSGDYDNSWKHSNGAWIRSEIWACCLPGRPDLAARYAYYDACVDHGVGEGTYAAIFTAALESAAFVVSDRRVLLDIGLSYIPQDCRTARAVRLAMDCYSSGVDWREARRRVVEDSADLGWFQAPGNVAFVVIGWLYGEGDVKKSLLIAVNCGDDTDCTGATLGSIFGILGGASALPKDWAAYIGDDIISVAIDRGSIHGLPATCAELAERTLAMARRMLAENGVDAVIGEAKADSGDAADDAAALRAGERHAAWLAGLDGAVVYDFIHTLARVRYVRGPEVVPGGEAELEITLRNRTPGFLRCSVSYLPPEGFTLLEGRSSLRLGTNTRYTLPEESFRVRLRAGAEAAAAHRGVIQIVAEGRPTVMLIPLLFIGR